MKCLPCVTHPTVGFDRKMCASGTCNSLHHVVHAVHHMEWIYTYPFNTFQKTWFFGSLIPKGNSVTRISPSHFACDFPFPLEAGKVLLEAGRIDHPLGRMDERFVKNAVLVGLERASCDLNLHPF